MRYIFFVLVILGLHLYFLYHLEFTAWPEMLSYPYLRNEGFLLYKDMIHPYTPLLTIFLSFVYKFIGYDILGLKIISWSIILVSSVMVYVITRYLTKNKNLGLLSLLAYTILQPFLEGNMLWFDIAIVPLILCSLFFLFKWNDSKKIVYLLSSGVFIALAIFTKQSAGLFLVLSLVYLSFESTKIKHIVFFLIPSVLTGASLVVRLLTESAFTDFLNWTLIYPFTFWSKFPGYVQMSISTSDLLVLLIFTCPLLLLVFHRRLVKDKKMLLLLFFLVGSVVSIYPRFSFFHFQTSLTLFLIIGFYISKDFGLKKIVLGMLGLLGILGVLVHKPVVAQNWDRETRFLGRDDFKMVEIIKSYSKNENKILLLGFPSQYYVMAGKIPPKRWTDNFGWYLEIPGVQEEIISRWEMNPPNVIFRRIPDQGNWFDLGTYQPKKIVDYIGGNYILEGSEQSQKLERWVRKGYIDKSI